MRERVRLSTLSSRAIQFLSAPPGAYSPGQILFTTILWACCPPCPIVFCFGQARGDKTRTSPPFKCGQTPTIAYNIEKTEKRKSLQGQIFFTMVRFSLCNVSWRGLNYRFIVAPLASITSTNLLGISLYKLLVCAFLFSFMSSAASRMALHKSCLFSNCLPA